MRRLSPYRQLQDPNFHNERKAKRRTVLLAQFSKMAEQLTMEELEQACDLMTGLSPEMLRRLSLNLFREAATLKYEAAAGTLAEEIADSVPDGLDTTGLDELALEWQDGRVPG